MPISRQASSFRDPGGFVFTEGNTLLRQVNRISQEDYDYLMNSGLYEGLVKEGLLIPHIEVDLVRAASPGAYKVLQPEIIPFISYPYEWCFSQLKDAALATLAVQKKALALGMSLKDCSAYNIQFLKGRPILIDSLSFEKYREGEPWVAYRQFCQHFLAPLSLMSYKDVRLNQLSKDFIDGIPLDLAGSLLPLRTRFRPHLVLHLHLHAKSQKHFADRKSRVRKTEKVGLRALRGLVDSLETLIRSLHWQNKKSEWGDYYSELGYSPESLGRKKELISEFLDQSNPETVWDLGANRGIFSRIAAGKGKMTVSLDLDPLCVEQNYLECLKTKETRILPLVLDLNNPSPKIGWENSERMSLFERGPADMVLALALVHHLAISNNVPLEMLSGLFGKIGRRLVIEFVPKNDPQVQRLLLSREDIFTEYGQHHFEQAFQKHFEILRRERISGTERTVYLMKRRT